MPQKAKFSKEEIISVAINIVCERGIEALTARNLAKVLDSSSRPIFTTFNNMEEVYFCVTLKAKEIYKNLVEKGLKEEIAFRGVGKAYIKFARLYPKLFQLLFMKEMDENSNLQLILGEIDESYNKILASITDNYKVSKTIAEKLYEHLWIYSHGIAVLIATKMCKFSDNQISDMLTDIFKGLLIKFKSEGAL